MSEITSETASETVPELKEETVASKQSKQKKAKAPSKKASKSVSKKAPARAMAPKPTEKAPREREDGLVVFAFRLSQAERDLIHLTAGPARASRYVRRVCAAFANEDEGAFKAVLKEAREIRG